MSSVDNRVVKMEFDNDLFKRKAAETKQSLGEVDKAVANAGRGKGLLSLSNAMQTVGVQASKMAIVTTTALATVANKAVNAGIELAKSLTIDPVRAGFQEYESLLSKQNVIMNATGKSAGTVKKVLNDLNHYSDKTIFSFGDMTEGLTSFVNAGVALPDAAQAMKGIANASALAGASTQEAQSSFRAFGQALGQGYLGLQDYRQAAITGKIGTVGFKQSLIDAAVAQGTLTKRGDEYVTKSGKVLTATKNFDLTLQEQWASTEVLNEALRNYGDENTKLGKKAFKAAQDVRTFTAFMDTLKESIGSGFAQFFTALIGGLEESTALWTGLSNTVGAAANKFFNFITTATMTWKALGGGAKVMEGLRNIAAPFVALFQAIGDAWQAAFPTTGKSAGSVLYDMSAGFASITAPLQTVAKWITAATPFLEVFFKTIKMGVNGLGAAAGFIKNLASSLADLIDVDASSVGGGIASLLDSILSGLSKLGQMGIDAAGQFIDGLMDGFTNGSIDAVASVAGAGLLYAIYRTLKKLFKGGLNINFGQDLFENVAGSFEALTGSLKAMQQQIQSKTLMNIAIAIGLITASVVALSFIDQGKLAKSLAAISVGFAQLLISMGLLTKIAGTAGFIQVPLIAGAMVLMATALFILVGAIALMGQLEWETIGKGLAGIGGALVVISVGMKLMPKSLPITAAGLLLVSVALNAIGGAIALMGNLEWETIGKGLATTAGALVIIGAAMRFMPLNMPVTAAGLILVGIALTAVAGALKIMGSMSWKEIGRGLTVLGGAMAILAVGLNAMSGSLLGSAAMIVAATAINIMIPSLLIMSKMSWEEIGKSLAALAGGMIILGLAMTGMVAAIPGALALLIVAPALLALAGALVILSTLSWEDLAIALVALAAGLTIIGLAGLLIGPVVPALMGLGVALLLMGAGLALAGVGILAFSAGLAALVALGAVGIAYLGDAIMGFIELMPALGAGFGLLIVEFTKTITKNAPVFIDAFVTMLTELIDAAEELLPKLGKLAAKALKTLLGVLEAAIPDIATAGINIVIGLLQAFTDKLPDVITEGKNLILAWITGMGTASTEIAVAAVTAVTDFMVAVLGEIAIQAPIVIDAMTDLGGDMAEGLARGIGKMAFSPLRAIKGLAGGMVQGAKDVVKSKSPSKVFRDIGMFIVQGLTIGIQNNAAAAIGAVTSMVGGQIAAANLYIDDFINKLDQRAAAAEGKAVGLARAAEKAANAAGKTKNKKDDKAADRLAGRADKATTVAEKAAQRAQNAKDAADRRAEFKKASTFEKAQMRSEDAAEQLDNVRAKEASAAAKLAEADALDRQSKAKGVKASQRKAMRKQADDLRKQAAEDAKAANKQLVEARKSASEALAYQKIAGDEAAAEFQAYFNSDAQSAADDKAFEKLSDAEKAAKRKEQADAMQKQANADLEAAKRLAYTDLEAANELADQARSRADLARQYLADAEQFAASAAQGISTAAVAPGASGSVVNLSPTDAAAIAMSQYETLYDSASAAAAGERTVEFNQYNTSPEALNPIEVYRQTNNLFTYAVDKIDDAA